MSNLPTISVSLLPGTEEYQQDLLVFFDWMIHKLHKHRSKGHWENASPEQYMVLLDGERNELQEALESNNTAWILEESADVANMALILASSAIRRAFSHE